LGRAEYLRQQAEMSLRRLGLERTYLFQPHLVEYCTAEGSGCPGITSLAARPVARHAAHPGTSKVEHLEENLGAARVQLTQAQVEELMAAA
jgi:aryl-alcohol dehydrogenase-like predicted oxidoreductase